MVAHQSYLEGHHKPSGGGRGKGGGVFGWRARPPAFPGQPGLLFVCGGGCLNTLNGVEDHQPLRAECR